MAWARTWDHSPPLGTEISRSDCLKQHWHRGGRLKSHVEKELTRVGGIRRAPTIAGQVVENLAALEAGGWQIVEREFAALRSMRARGPAVKDAERERQAADVIHDMLTGFGPKQSRNLWQWLGLTRYEIPVDSRITEWLNAHGFAIKLSATGLADREYYNFVSDGIRQLCAACDVLPCVFDAAVFSFKDEN